MLLSHLHGGGHLSGTLLCLMLHIQAGQEIYAVDGNLCELMLHTSLFPLLLEHGNHHATFITSRSTDRSSLASAPCDLPPTKLLDIFLQQSVM